MAIDGINLQIAARYDNFELKLMNVTLAKRSQACGVLPTIGINATPRDIGLLHESSFLNRDVMTYTTERIYGEDQPWLYEICDPCTLEDQCIAAHADGRFDEDGQCEVNPDWIYPMLSARTSGPSLRPRRAPCRHASKLNLNNYP